MSLRLCPRSWLKNWISLFDLSWDSFSPPQFEYLWPFSISLSFQDTDDGASPCSLLFSAVANKPNFCKRTRSRFKTQFHKQRWGIVSASTGVNLLPVEWSQNQFKGCVEWDDLFPSHLCRPWFCSMVFNKLLCSLDFSPRMELHGGEIPAGVMEWDQCRQ